MREMHFQTSLKARLLLPLLKLVLASIMRVCARCSPCERQQAPQASGKRVGAPDPPRRARVCERESGCIWAPDVEIVGTEEVQVNFVPNHLHHIVFELTKNSMRAVLEHHGVKNYDAPPIQVVLTDDEREFAIKISDQGGGIPRKDMHLIWSYLYSTTSTKTAQQLLDSINGQGSPVVDAAIVHPTNAVVPKATATAR